MNELSSGYSVHGNSDRLRREVDMLPFEPSNLTAAQPVKCQRPEVAIPALMIEDLEHLLFGERLHLFTLRRKPINQGCDVLLQVPLFQLALEHCPRQVEQIVHRSG
ncbi:hypothetical protein [Antrihabitans sp. YC2-6]|uniref:hypothetical protein n=1 Tax=Antrihabitans sp. YC2-6 TaxID=2799498 RepID=UPI001F30E2D2|nr:hypothetical protein [Antrihabitans sp. YC2-6]